MRGLSQRKSAIARNRALRELPPDDGLIPVMMSERTLFGTRHFFLLIPPEAMRAHCEKTMAVHDARWPWERWGGNQWGEEWVRKPERREDFSRRMPLLKTDLDYRSWRRATHD